MSNSQNKDQSQPPVQKQAKKAPLEKASQRMGVAKTDKRLSGIDLDRTAVMMVESLEFASHDGEKLSRPSKITYNEKDWIQFRNFRQAYNSSVIEIVNLPKGWWVPPVTKLKKQ